MIFRHDNLIPAKFGGKQHASSYLCAILMCDDIHPNIRSKFHKKFGKTKQRNWGRLWALKLQDAGLLLSKIGTILILRTGKRKSGTRLKLTARNRSFICQLENIQERRLDTNIAI